MHEEKELAIKFIVVLQFLSIWAYVSLPLSLLLPSIILAGLLLALSWVDYHTYRLPNYLISALLIGGTLMLLQTGKPILNHLLGLACGYLVIVLIQLAYQQIRQRPGIGRGDAKLCAAGGLWLGISSLPSVLLIASLSGLIVSSLIATAHRDKTFTLTTKIPFGPFISIAIWLIWLYGPLAFPFSNE